MAKRMTPAQRDAKAKELAASLNAEAAKGHKMNYDLLTRGYRALKDLVGDQEAEKKIDAATRRALAKRPVQASRSPHHVQARLLHPNRNVSRRVW